MADLVAISVICVIYFGPNSKHFSMGYVPAENIVMTLIVTAIDIVILIAFSLYGNWFALKEKTIQLNISANTFRLINKNEGLFFWHVMEALVFPFAVLGHHWNFLYFLKNV